MARDAGEFLSLKEFAKGRKRRGAGTWVDLNVSEDHRAEMLEAASDISAAVITEWLVTLGYDEATDGKVRTWVKKQGQ